MLAYPTAAVETVEKEALPTLHFAQEDVLHTLPERQQRRYDANRATMLGNNYHGKVDIYFRTADGTVKRVQTTVWATHDLNLTLKAGITLPLQAVIGFDFY